jgi:MFS family permease
VLRLLLLSTVTVESSGEVVFIQVLHGACFACFWIAAVDYANMAAPQGMEGTAQSLVSTCMYIVGPGIGSVVWSYIYQAYGAPVAYICGASVAAANAVALGKLQLGQPATEPLLKP